MSQNINILQPTNSIREDVARHNENYATLRSQFAGSAFPASPTRGQACFRTDLGRNGNLFVYSGDTTVGQNGWISNEELNETFYEILNARGSKLSLDQRLDIALNEDGTLKDNVSGTFSEWQESSGLVFIYVNNTTFKTEGNTSDIFIEERRVKINLEDSYFFSTVQVSNYDLASDKTTVTIKDSSLNSTLLNVEFHINTPYLDEPISNLVQAALDTKQANLVSGTTIKTINEESLLGSGNIEISTKGDVFIKPNSMKPLFEKVSPSSIKVPAGFIVKIGNAVVEKLTDTTITLASNLDMGAKVAGTDYYVYAKIDGTFYISKNKSLNKANERLIGGFHYGLVPENFTARNNLTTADAYSVRGIWANSCWDLQWLPKNDDPRGMTYNILGFWNDIYFCNDEHIVNGTSKAGAKIAGGATTTGRGIPKIPLAFGGNGSTTYGKMTWFNTAEIASAYGKRLLNYAEFQALAYGVKEASSAGGADDGTCKHIADYLSPYMEQATGIQYTWSSEVQGIGGNGWDAGITDGRGSIYANASQPTAAMLGGTSTHTSSSGSRCSAWVNYLWYSAWYVGGRFACDHLNLAPARTVVSA